MGKTKIGRNHPCPCGSQKKYKNCHLAFDRETPQAPSGEGFQMNPEGLEVYNSLCILLQIQKYHYMNFV